MNQILFKVRRSCRSELKAELQKHKLSKHRILFFINEIYLQSSLTSNCNLTVSCWPFGILCGLCINDICAKDCEISEKRNSYLKWILYLKINDLQVREKTRRNPEKTFIFSAIFASATPNVNLQISTDRIQFSPFIRFGDASKMYF